MTDILKPEEIGALMGAAAENGAHLQDLYDKLRAAQTSKPEPGKASIVFTDEGRMVYKFDDPPPPSIEFGEALHKAQTYAQAAKQAATDAQTAAQWCEENATRYPGPDYNGGADDDNPRPLATAFQEEDGSWSIRRIVFAASFLLVAILCLASPWLPIQDNTKTVALALIGAAFTSVTAGRFAEAMDK